MTHGSISDVKAAHAYVMLFPPSPAVACREIRSLPRSELGSTKLRTLWSIGSHTGATGSMTKKMDLKFNQVFLFVHKGDKSGTQMSINL